MRVATGVRPLAMAMVLGTACAHVMAFDLVSAQEMHASLAAGEPLTAKTRPVAGAPEIEVVHPKLDAPVASPTPIQLMFVPAAASKVRPETFKVLYGRLRIDITQRLVNEARITAEGVTVKEASLPKGTHRLVLSVQDVQGREGSKSLDFEIK